MLECEEVRERLVDLLDGDLPLPEVRAVRMHLIGCYTCREERDNVTDVLEEARRLLSHPAPRYRFDSLRLAMGAAGIALEDQTRPRRFSLWRAAVSVAAAGLVAVLFSRSVDLVNVTTEVVERSQSSYVRDGETSLPERVPVMTQAFVAYKLRLDEEFELSDALRGADERAPELLTPEAVPSPHPPYPREG